MSFAPAAPLPRLPIMVVTIGLEYCPQYPPELSGAPLLLAVLLPEGVGAPMNVIRLVRQAGGGQSGNGNGSSSQENDGSETYEESADGEEEEEYYETSEEDLDGEEVMVSWENFAWISVI